MRASHSPGFATREPRGRRLRSPAYGGPERGRGPRCRQHQLTVAEPLGEKKTEPLPRAPPSRPQLPENLTATAADWPFASVPLPEAWSDPVVPVTRQDTFPPTAVTVIVQLPPGEEMWQPLTDSVPALCGGVGRWLGRAVVREALGVGVAAPDDGGVGSGRLGRPDCTGATLLGESDGSSEG